MELATQNGTCTEQASSNSSLLDLPHAILHSIITELATPDKKRFMAACRTAALLTLLAESRVSLRITEDTKFAGTSKVLNWLSAPIQLQVIRPSYLVLHRPTHDLHRLMSAVFVIMGDVPSHVAPACQWEGVTKVTIQDTSLRCLVPSFLAAACPQLAHYKIIKSKSRLGFTSGPFTTDIDSCLPLRLCSSLKQLEIEATCQSPFQLPPAYHSLAEIRHSLPNVDTLVFGRQSSAVLVEAFATQLTRLELNDYTDRKGTVAQSLRQCSKLQQLHVYPVVLPDITDVLKIVKLGKGKVSDSEFKELLQIPSLTTLHLDSIDHIQKDWSDHASSWQELHLSTLPQFTALAKLNLSSLKTLSVGPDPVLRLPDPSDAGSLEAVQRAADNLAYVGQIMMNMSNTTALAHFGKCGTLHWETKYWNSDNEHRAAELLHTAMQRIGPMRSCNCESLWNRPLLVSTIVEWGQSFIELVYCGRQVCHMGTHTWQALQRLHKLESVAFNPSDFPEFYSMDKEHAHDIPCIASNVYNAAQHYVIPANRKLRMEFAVLPHSLYHPTLNPSPATISKVALHAALQNAVPPGSKVASVELHPVSDNEGHTNYGQQCSYWVVILEPSHSAA